MEFDFRYVVCTTGNKEAHVKALEELMLTKPRLLEVEVEAPVLGVVADAAPALAAAPPALPAVVVADEVAVVNIAPGVERMELEAAVVAADIPVPSIQACRRSGRARRPRSLSL